MRFSAEKICRTDQAIILCRGDYLKTFGVSHKNNNNNILTFCNIYEKKSNSMERTPKEASGSILLAGSPFQSRSNFVDVNLHCFTIIMKSIFKILHFFPRSVYELYE